MFQLASTTILYILISHFIHVVFGHSLWWNVDACDIKRLILIKFQCFIDFFYRINLSVRWLFRNGTKIIKIFDIKKLSPNYFLDSVGLGWNKTVSKKP